MKLESGKEIKKLIPLTMAQRTECESLSRGVLKDGEFYTVGVPQARNQFCLYALGLTDIEALVDYTPDELTEIAGLANGEASKAKDPTPGG